MVKQAKNKKKPINKKMIKENPNLDQILYLKTLLKYTLKAQNGASESLDTLFLNQADRILDQLAKLSEGNR